jgi:hypothetical protein
MAIAVGSSTLSAFVQSIAAELGRRTVESTSKKVHVFVTSIHRRWRKELVKVEITTEAQEVTTVLEFTNNLPDEARVALLDLDFTNPDLNGKKLHWNAKKGVWEPRVGS